MRRIQRNFTSTTPKTIVYDDEFLYDYYGGPNENWDFNDYYTNFFQFDVEHVAPYISAVKWSDYVVSIVAFFINIVHLVVLTRKDLRANLIYTIMAGVCVCDLLVFFHPLITMFLESGIVYRVGTSCDDEQGRAYFHRIITWISGTAQAICRPCSALLTLSMTLFRAFSVKFPMSHVVELMMAKPITGTVTVISLLTICTAWKSFLYFHPKFTRLPE
uniref:G-protein coupled receptors family 1 profile domain-containing protein n=1 Tax=Caenorhabditis japonica TaxID=281687 RepID=A0A8R1E1N3_CAEJA